MALRSHVDPVLYSRFILLDESDIEPEHISILTAPATAPGSTDAVGRVLSDALKRHPRVAFHEAYHCFQGLRIPFLHRYAVIVWYSFGKAFAHLCQGSEDHRSWALEEAPLLGLLSEKFQCTRTAGDALGTPLSILDIVEGVTSLV